MRHRAARLFAIGDRVRWHTHSGHAWEIKEGFVTAIVPPGQRPDGLGGVPRGEVSYVVRVGSAYYWPRASGLRKFASADEFMALAEDLEQRANEAVAEYRTSFLARDYGMGYAAGMRAAAEALRKKIRS